MGLPLWVEPPPGEDERRRKMREERKEALRARIVFLEGMMRTMERFGAQEPRSVPVEHAERKEELARLESIDSL
ncbi:uncharacterized protein RCC_08041 [Ramularia collo-cygni]|uniref:Uncharacterized protein n=1 Tax=Ramularia collo-cygni TaxID=112498 RepID=A0A2D3UWH5_9PEZI|nr:uncharacterized protein RCC_08041 [Ramularia collo-cygni]CZT22172.1 uncharacterized protein RCC_08041 [Ramularia collo-cygni]